MAHLFDHPAFEAGAFAAFLVIASILGSVLS